MKLSIQNFLIKGRWLSLISACLFILFACSKDPVPDPGPTGQEGSEGGGTEVDSDPESTEYYQYGLGRLEIVTEGRVDITSKEDYVGCTATLNGGGNFSYRFALPGKIRGRGNSTWFWYPKKPYRLKLDKASKMMGMKSNRDWVLLADFRDVTHMMNNVAFTMAHELGLPHANRSRYVQLVINGSSKGLYMITEQVEEGGHRVTLDASSGMLIALDMNDGPGENPSATDNFWSEVFGMACAVKYPKDVNASDKARVRSALGDLEKAINTRNWNSIQSLLDVDAMINYILIQEIISNGELDNNPSMRSGYIHRKSSADKWVMGPMWDADAGFGYDASDMFNVNGMCHTYFVHNQVLVFGTEPFYHRGAMNGTASDFFCRLFGIPEFVRLLKERWNSRKDSLLEAVLNQIKLTEAQISSAAAFDASLWGITNFTHSAEVAKLKVYLKNRFAYLDTIIPNYPEYRP